MIIFDHIKQKAAFWFPNIGSKVHCFRITAFQFQILQMEDPVLTIDDDTFQVTNERKVMKVCFLL